MIDEYTEKPYGRFYTDRIETFIKNNYTCQECFGTKSKRKTEYSCDLIANGTTWRAFNRHPSFCPDLDNRETKSFKGKLIPKDPCNTCEHHCIKTVFKTYPLVEHHINGNPHDRRRENRVTLCKSCHNQKKYRKKTIEEEDTMLGIGEENKQMLSEILLEAKKQNKEHKEMHAMITNIMNTLNANHLVLMPATIPIITNNSNTNENNMHQKTMPVIDRGLVVDDEITKRVYEECPSYKNKMIHYTVSNEIKNKLKSGENMLRFDALNEVVKNLLIQHGVPKSYYDMYIKYFIFNGTLRKKDRYTYRVMDS